MARTRPPARNPRPGAKVWVWAPSPRTEGTHARQEGRPAGHPEAVARQGAADLRQDPRQRPRAVRQRGGRPPGGLFDAVKHNASRRRATTWEPKEETKGPSDEQATLSGRAGAATARGETHGGVDAYKSKYELYEDAKRADIEGRSNMTKDELVDALQKAQRPRVGAGALLARGGGPRPSCLALARGRRPESPALV